MYTFEPEEILKTLRKLPKTFGNPVDGYNTFTTHVT